MTATYAGKAIHPYSEARIRREAIAIQDEEGWHVLVSAAPDAFRVMCGAVITVDDIEHIAEWAEIHDLGTRYCIECLAINEGEWTGARFPHSLLHALRDERERRWASWQQGKQGYVSTTVREHFMREQERGPKA